MAVMRMLAKIDTKIKEENPQHCLITVNAIAFCRGLEFCDDQSNQNHPQSPRACPESGHKDLCVRP